MLFPVGEIQNSFASGTDQDIFPSMSTVKIPAELSDLKDAKGATVQRHLRELGEQDLPQSLHATTDAMFCDMDQQETDNAR